MGATPIKGGISWPSIFKNFEGTDDDKKRSLIHLESLLDQEKIRSKESQEVYHKNEKSYLNKISKLEKEVVAKERQLNDFKSKAEVFENKLNDAQSNLNAQKAENLILKEEKEDIKAQYLEEIENLKEELTKKNKNLESLRTDLMQTKDTSMRFETALRNKDAELSRLQMQLDKEKENRDREHKELRKQINYESDRRIEAVREAERNLAKANMNQETLENYKKELDRKDEIIKQRDHEIDRQKTKALEVERKFNDKITKEKDMVRDEFLKKIKEKSSDNSVDEYKRQILTLTKQNEDLISKTEALMSSKDLLTKELNQAERAHNESAMRIKELNLKYQSYINDLEKKLKDANFDIYKKEALIAKITSENEHLSQENFRVKSAQNINDSILRLPDTCFIDIQSAKKQREAVHEATKKMIEEMAEDQAKGREDHLLNNIAQLEEKNKKLYLDMYENIGMELNKYEISYNYKQKQVADDREKDNQLKERKEQVKEEFRYKLDTVGQKTYDEFVEDQVRKQDKISKSNKIDTQTVDSLFDKYKL